MKKEDYETFPPLGEVPENYDQSHYNLSRPEFDLEDTQSIPIQGEPVKEIIEKIMSGENPGEEALEFVNKPENPNINQLDLNSRNSAVVFDTTIGFLLESLEERLYSGKDIPEISNLDEITYRETEEGLTIPVYVGEKPTVESGTDIETITRKLGVVVKICSSLNEKIEGFLNSLPEEPTEEIFYNLRLITLNLERLRKIIDENNIIIEETENVTTIREELLETDDPKKRRGILARMNDILSQSRSKERARVEALRVMDNLKENLEKLDEKLGK